jgi:hypothetical protein
VPSTRTLLIGDTDYELEVGHALGIPVLLVTPGRQSAERLKCLMTFSTSRRYKGWCRGGFARLVEELYAGFST